MERQTRPVGTGGINRYGLLFIGVAALTLAVSIYLSYDALIAFGVLGKPIEGVVIGKAPSSGGGAGYRLSVEVDGVTCEVDVTRSAYERYSPGDSIKLMRGPFGAVTPTSIDSDKPLTGLLLFVLILPFGYNWRRRRLGWASQQRVE